MLLDPTSLFILRRDDLLKSLDDGYDLDRSAAEYLLAYDNLDYTPEDSLSQICKTMSRRLMHYYIWKNEGYEEEAEDEGASAAEVGGKGGTQTAAYLYGMEGLSSEPSNHPWVDRHTSTANKGVRHAAWPDVTSNANHHYAKTHPFHENFHPLLRRHAVSGDTMLKHLLKDYYLKPSPTEKSVSERQAENEMKWHNHHASKNNPVVMGEKDKDSNERVYNFGGPLTLHGTTVQSNHDLYERDFQRWKLDNGHGKNDDNPELREEHFEARADEWDSDDTTFEAPPEKEFSYEDVFQEMEDANKPSYEGKGVHHGHGLGWFGYNMGLEWLSPEERTAVYDHMMEKGSVSQDAQKVTLPDGTILPMARFVYNFMERVTPEMNWWARSHSVHAPNAHHRPESNENDFHGGENRFLQHALNQMSYMPRYDDNSSIADMIFEQLNLHPEIEEKTDEEGNDISDKFNILPRFGMHTKSMKEKGLPEKHSIEEIREAVKKHRAIDGVIDPMRNNLSMEDLYYLAGYHPETREHMPDHPIYGELENPIIPKDDLEDLVKEATQYSGQAALGKDIRNALAHKKARFGPNPKYHDDDLFETVPSGEHTIGNAHYWWKPFAQMGGVGRALPTYMEFIHHMLMDPMTKKSPFGEIDDAGGLIVNKNLMNIVGHVAPYVAPMHVGEELDPESGKTLWKKLLTAMPPEYHINAHDVTRAVHNSDGTLSRQGSSFKNNITDHLSARSPEYTNWAMNRTNAERQQEIHGSSMDAPVGGHPITEYTFASNPEGYGEGASDKISQRQAVDAHLRATILGHILPPENPQKKKVHDLNSLQSTGAPVSTGDVPSQWFDFVGWSPTIKTSAKTVKPEDMITSEKEMDQQYAIGVVSRLLNTRNPAVIAEYLNQGDFSALSSDDRSRLNAVMGDIAVIDPQAIDSETQEEAVERHKREQIQGIQNILGMGSHYPSTRQEEMVATELMKLEQLLDDDEFIHNELTPEGINMIRDQMQNLRGELYQLQQQASNIQPKSSKKSNWWKERAKQKGELYKNDMEAIIGAAKILKPMVEENQPDAFDPENKMKFLHNSSQLMRMANRWLLSAPHNAHGQTNYGYKVSRTVAESPTKDLGEGKHHADIANYLKDHGTMIDGNMSVSQALKALGLSSTPEHKEHVRQVIDQSNAMNIPLHVSSLNSMITSGNTDSIAGFDTTDYHESDYHNLLDEGQKSVSSQFSTPGSRVSNWKKHEIHSLPRGIMRYLNQGMFGENMANHGLMTFTSDVHGRGQLKSTSLKRPTKDTKNHLDSLIAFTPDALSPEGEVEQIPVQEEILQTADWGKNRPISAPTPQAVSTVWDLFDAGRMDFGYEANPTFGFEFDVDGNPIFGDKVNPTPLHSVPLDALHDLHGKEIVNSVMDQPGVTPQQSQQYRDVGYQGMQSEDPMSISTGEMTEFLEGLLNPDVMLMKASKEDWIPLIRPMHRIFSLDDLKEFRGFSDSWVVSTWYEGKRLLLVKDDDVLFLDENGKKSGVPKKIRDAASKLSDKNYIVDGILNDEEFNIIDILSYDGTDTTDMKTNERLKILRGQLESYDGIAIPGPFNTRVTDREGLETAANELKGDGYVLLRDAQSTYMKGEKRHPKWLILREGKTLNFIILDKRGKGPFTYQLGAGPILTPEGLGNRAVEYKGKHYMDVGTAHRVAKPFAEGDIVEGVIAGVAKKTRGGRDVYNVQFTSIDKEGQGEGPASAESLSLLTKSFAPVLIPHSIDYDGNVIKILLNDVDVVEYQVNKFNDTWYLNEPVCVMGDLKKSNYSFQLSESLRPFWSPIASLMLNGYVEKMDKDDEVNVVPKKIDPKRIERESAGILDQKERNILLKPRMVKALEIALRALDVIAKEKMSWSGPKGLGIDMATPVESPSGPTKLRDDSTLPDYDMRPRPGEDPEKPTSVGKKGKHRLTHAKLESDEGESVDFDIEDDQPTVRLS